MLVLYSFYISFFGIVILLLFKISELKRGAKPFSVLRYKADIYFHKKFAFLREKSRYINMRTARIALAFVIGNVSAEVEKWMNVFRQSKMFRMIKGKVSPINNGPVSSFLQDIAQFKNAAADNMEKKAEEDVAEEAEVKK